MILAAQPPALSHRAAALLLAGVGGQDAAGAPLSQVVVTLPQLTWTSSGEGGQQWSQLHTDMGGGGGGGARDVICGRGKGKLREFWVMILLQRSDLETMKPNVCLGDGRSCYLLVLR